METLMILYMIALIYRTTKANCVELAECFDGLSHDQFSRLLEEGCCWPTRLWQSFARRLIGEGGYLLLDDTVLEKWGQAMFGVYWVYSSRLGKVVQGINVVVVIWTDGQRRVPIGIKIWRKGGPSKVVLAAKLLRWARRLGLQPQYVVFDSWYSAKRLLQQIRSYGWHFVTRLKKNRKLAGTALSHHWRQRYGHGQGQLTGGVEVLVVKDGSRYWASSDVSLSVPQVKALYQLKQQLEETFKILKDQLRWGKNPARTQAAQVAHLHLCLMAFCVLDHEATHQRTTVYRLRRSLFRQAIPLHTPLFEPFMNAA
jgi:putative transposase